MRAFIDWINTIDSFRFCGLKFFLNVCVWGGGTFHIIFVANSFLSIFFAIVIYRVYCWLFSLDTMDRIYLESEKKRGL